ncbi:MAG TPA: NADH-ubiquinone oxidoreductase-F iron-sulfur binding region domain-containing protein, partial [Burkholderiaceae bacterium]
EWPAEWFRVDDNIRRAGPLLEAAPELGAAVRATLQRGAEATIDEIERSGLRGRGGAGFATGPKWRACRAAPAPHRFVVCNADEGEPGTFKDRVLLTRQPDLVFDGMTACALAVGARRGFVYLRGEYLYLLPQLEEALARRRALGLLGPGICGDRACEFDIEIHVGAGAYVCGEESALIESLEGKRGVPRNRPPYPVTSGYLGFPTVVNNVETFAAAAWIVRHGAPAWRAYGTAASSGTKLLSISGDVERPGIYEVPLGIRIDEALAQAGGAGAVAVQVSGPSGQCLAAGEFARRLAFEDAPTAGALMVFGPERDLFEVARNFTEFFAHESCGFCTPCRVGTALLARTMNKLSRGGGSRRDLEDIEAVNRSLLAAAHCGLGHSACNPILDTLRKFPQAYARRLNAADFEPGFDLDAALAPARESTGRDDPAAHLEGRR